MKKLLSIIALFAISSSAMAGFNSNEQNQTSGGFVAQPEKITVAQALKAKDDTYVTLDGVIIKQLKDDDYLFQDDTGSIKVEIDDDVWQGQNIGPHDKIRITGELDNDWNEKANIDVQRLQRIK
ncbi:uncharacterized protein (TIGR00156 family) [Cricetibacter osteomyelitidis]|uniref:Uncharacterized protein (TIGR00156 family) n=1 Tax=Cricetibacter osteomyelitidis TaxID=1521931 RepID=A0A4R2SV80_9PAST|nr:NirD/YgiW/YdeI family stress tolerance protein [Cricetibacter osteomyelitidis]TCP93380.1 uncharacterized protein (TIGR00156 family) [Cricetibacter osteomyelitidis]